MAAGVLHIGDIGTIFELSVKDNDGLAVDLTSQTLLKIIFQKPDQTVVPKTPTVYGTPANGVVRYALIAGDIDLEGKYKIQAEVTLSTGKWRSDIQSFSVKGNL